MKATFNANRGIPVAPKTPDTSKYCQKAHGSSARTLPGGSRKLGQCPLVSAFARCSATLRGNLPCAWPGAPASASAMASAILQVIVFISGLPPVIVSGVAAQKPIQEAGPALRLRPGAGRWNSNRHERAQCHNTQGVCANK